MSFHPIWQTLIQRAAKWLTVNGNLIAVKSVTFQPREGQFSSMLNASMGKQIKGSVGYGVTVSSIKEDTETPFKLVFDPSHPDANDDGYVEMPNVDPLREMIDLMSATRSYEANITVLMPINQCL